MDKGQIHVAAVRLEEAFVPAINRLRLRRSTEVVVDALFEGVDDCGGFVVRFEVSIARCARQWKAASSLCAGMHSNGSKIICWYM